MRASVVLLLTALAACSPQDTGIRHYREVSVPPPATAQAPSASTPSDMSGPVPGADVKLDWTKPGAWTEKPATGPRLATFDVGGAECTVVSFPGDTGGVEANIRRWLGQLKTERTDAEIAAFAASAESFTTEGGIQVQFFDFASLVPDGAPASMLAALAHLDGATVFVKLMGNPALLAAERDNFVSLCRSLRPRS